MPSAITLSVALKEWHLLIRALLDGRQALLLRKGGILESENQFALEHPCFLFFPTFIHQDPRMVKPEFRAGLKSVREEPSKIEICGWGEVARIFELAPHHGRQRLDQLSDLYIWDAPLLDMRFAYRPEKPLYLVLVRAYSLPAPVVIDNTLEYAGCKSWVPLTQEIPTAGSEPALPEQKMQGLLERITRTIQT